MSTVDTSTRQTLRFEIFGSNVTLGEASTQRAAADVLYELVTTYVDTLQQHESLFMVMTEWDEFKDTLNAVRMQPWLDKKERASVEAPDGTYWG